MQAKENLRLAILAAFEAEESATLKIDTATALTDVLCAFADVLRGPVPEVQAVELAADNTQALILVELQSINAKLDSIQKSSAGTAIILDACSVSGMLRTSPSS